MQETPEQVFGHVLQSLRRERGLSQEQLGFEAGLHRTYISLLERGRYSPSLSALFRLALALSVSPTELVRRVEIGLNSARDPARDRRDSD